MSVCCVCEALHCLFADLIRDIKDPEHPHTLEELNVVSEDCVTVHRHHCCSGTSQKRGG